MAADGLKSGLHTTQPHEVPHGVVIDASEMPGANKLLGGKPGESQADKHEREVMRAGGTKFKDANVPEANHLSKTLLGGEIKGDVFDPNGNQIGSCTQHVDGALRRRASAMMPRVFEGGPEQTTCTSTAKPHVTADVEKMEKQGGIKRNPGPNMLGSPG